MNELRALEELSRRVWDERRVVTYLLYKLTVAKLLLASDDRRFVSDALDEVDRAVSVLRNGEAARDEALRDLAEVWQVHPYDLSLPEVVRRSPPPFDHTFGEHLRAFRSLAEEIDDVARQNHALAVSGYEHIAASIEIMTGPSTTAPATYDASGRLDPAGGVGRRLREAL